MTLKGWPYTTFATGWYQIGWSAEYAVGDVKPAKYFDRDLVLYRGDSGRIVVLDAYCLHYGAHLGHGGKVEGDDLRCPFHAWKWSCSGRNIEIPYSRQRPVGKSLRSYPVIERSGLIMMWYDHNGAAPHFEPPIVPEFEDDSYYPVYPHGCADAETGFPPQLQLENAVDFVHLEYVHNWNAGPPVMETFEDRGQTFFVAANGLLETPKGVVNMRTEITIWGVGLVYSHLTGIRDMGYVSGNTPIDHDRSIIRTSTAVRRKDGDTGDTPDRTALAMIAGQNEEVLGLRPGGDRDIWEHMTYLPNALLMREEVPGMNGLRRWCDKFYPEPGREVAAAPDWRPSPATPPPTPVGA